MKNKIVEPFSIKKRIKSFGFAFKGFVWLFRFEHNARIHLFVLFVVVVSGLLFQITIEDWSLIFIVSGFVFSAEAFNSSVEFLADEVSLEKRERIRIAKDLAATGVLIAAIVAVLVGLSIFLPKVISLFN